MGHKKFAYKLKEFYLLETFQVKYYKAQLSASQDEYYRRAFEKMVYVEMGHADYFLNKMLQEGVEPPQIVEPFLKVAGSVLGESAELTGPYNTCRVGIALENKAIEMYRDFIIKGWGDPSLRDTLMGNLVDEEFHSLWMQNYIEHLRPDSGTVSADKNKPQEPV